MIGGLIDDMTENKIDEMTKDNNNVTSDDMTENRIDDMTQNKNGYMTLNKMIKQ